MEEEVLDDGQHGAVGLITLAWEERAILGHRRHLVAMPTHGSGGLGLSSGGQGGDGQCLQVPPHTWSPKTGCYSFFVMFLENATWHHCHFGAYSVVPTRLRLLWAAENTIVIQWEKPQVGQWGPGTLGLFPSKKHQGMAVKRSLPAAGAGRCWGPPQVWPKGPQQVE